MKITEPGVYLAKGNYDQKFLVFIVGKEPFLILKKNFDNRWA